MSGGLKGKTRPERLSLCLQYIADTLLWEEGTDKFHTYQKESYMPGLPHFTAVEIGRQ